MFPPPRVPFFVDGGESVDVVTIGRLGHELERVRQIVHPWVRGGSSSVVIGDDEMFLGNDLLPWLLLAVGAALVVANIAVLIRPPRAEGASSESDRLDRPPLRRVLPLILLGLVVSVWAGASLLHS